MTILTAPRIRVLVAHIDADGTLSSCVLVNEEDLPMPAGWIVVAQDPDDEWWAEVGWRSAQDELGDLWRPEPDW